RFRKRRFLQRTSGEIHRCAATHLRRSQKCQGAFQPRSRRVFVVSRSKMRRTHPAYQETVHPLKHEVIVTADGSTTIRIPEWDECYHSKNGAIVESYHVFIRSGLDLFDPPIRILEIGFGTGLNALITLLESIRKNQRIEYSGVEAYPVPADEVLKMNYAEELQCDREWFEKIHNIPWEAPQIIAPTFTLTK